MPAPNSNIQNPIGWPVESDWTEQLAEHFQSDSWHDLDKFVQQQRESETVFPPTDDVFRAFELTSFADTRVVILGQDPYHGQGQAHGLSFSVPESVTKFPPSLRNILKELNSDLGIEREFTSGDLAPWAKQGVLLLNTVLTVRESSANSHRKQGWEAFTDFVIRQFNNHPESVVFILWGKPAEKKADLIDARHAIICSPHPSPLSAHRGFFGSKPFSSANQHLIEFGRSPIEWDAI